MEIGRDVPQAATALEEVERLLGLDWPVRLVWWRAPHDGIAWSRAIDMYEKDDVFIICRELPGVNMEDVDISMIGDTLTIKDERKSPENVKDEKYECCEVC
jgi:HSP20 family molecular chaperone IbpA